MYLQICTFTDLISTYRWEDVHLHSTFIKQNRMQCCFCDNYRTIMTLFCCLTLYGSTAAVESIGIHHTLWRAISYNYTMPTILESPRGGGKWSNLPPPPNLR